MYRGKHNNSSGRAPRRSRSRTAVAALALVLVLGLAIGGTIAFLSMGTEAIENTFTPASVSCEVTENFNGTVKSNVNVKNTSDIAAYIRVKLVTYRVNADGQHIGGTATIPTFTPGTGWFEKDGYYYYSQPVAAGQSPANALIGSTGITLEDEYTDTDGGKQVIEVMAEAIQSVPTSVVAEKWNVTVGTDGTLSKGGSN